MISLQQTNKQTSIHPTYLVKLLQKRLPRRLLVLQQQSHNMRLLLPAVHRLLVLLPPFEYKTVNDTDIIDIAVSLKFFTDALPDERW